MKLTVTTFITLDGIAQAPGAPDEDRDGGFEHGGWLVPHFDEEFGRTMDARMAEADAFLLGRRTYEIFAAHWPQVTDESDVVARQLNSLPKHVASRTLERTDWQGASVLAGDVAEAVARLKREPGRELQVHGSLDLVQTLIRAELVDEFHLLVAPVVIGTGKRLFADVVPTGLELLDSRRTGAGVLIESYRTTGRPEYGDFPGPG